MNVKSIEIDNVKSFRESEVIRFNEDYNIIIGPNGGGKSNLLDIVLVALNKHIIKKYDIREAADRRTITEVEHFSGDENPLEKFIGDEGKDSRIKVELSVSSKDIDNIRSIIDNKGKLKQALEGFTQTQTVERFQFLENWSAESISIGDSYDFEIEELNPSRNQQNIVHTTGEDLYFEYLRYKNAFTLLAEEKEDLELNLYPVFFYFSPYREGSESRKISLHSDNYNQRFQSYLSSTSRESTSAIELGLFKLAATKRRYESRELHNGAFYDDPIVKPIDKHLSKLGYEWDLQLSNRNRNEYEIILEKGGKKYDMNQLSSGETEILNFLLGILPTEIQNGLIVIDEPELHLHPRWQLTLIDLITDLESETSNQFIFTTHSPSFITQETVSRVLRVSTDEENSSQISTPTNVEDNSLRDLLHIINSTNNEKMFFADGVILVEGPTDRVIFQHLVNEFLDENHESRAIEVLEVDGKGDFDKYVDFLDDLDIPNVVIGDRDYAKNIGGDQIQKLFKTSWSGVSDVLRDEKSTDFKSLAKKLDKAIENEDVVSLEELRDMWTYIKNRKSSFKKDPLTLEEARLWTEFLNEKRSEGIFVLGHGEIEDYLPDKYNNIKGALELTKKENYQDWADEENKRYIALSSMIGEIMDEKLRL